MFITLYRGSDQNHLQEKEIQEGRVVSEEAIQIVDKREAKGKGEKGKIQPSEGRVPETRRER